MTTDRILALMALMNEVDAPSRTYRHAVRRAAETLTDSPKNEAAQARGNAALLDIEQAVRRWVAAHPEQGDAEQPVAFVPPAAEGIPLAALDSATEGADRLDASARTPYGRNLLAHALDNATPYPIELHAEVCRFMADRLLEMLTVGKRPEHAVWQPEEQSEPGEQPQPEDPADPSRVADEAQQPEAEGVAERIAAKSREEPFVQLAEAWSSDGPLLDDETQQGKPQPDTPRCAHCTHPKGDHSDRKDHAPSRVVPRRPWCHACDAVCDYDGPPAVEAQQPETQAFVCKCPAELCHCGHHAAVAQQPKEA